jgi:lipid-binding SYLF domain-containing protein
MERRHLLLATGATLTMGVTMAAGCSTAGASDPAAKRREIDAGVDNALAQLYSSAAGSRELVSKAQGVLVFPSVISAGLVIGGSSGDGALRKHGTSTGYYSVGAGSVGLLAGAQSKSMFLLFMTQDAMQKFEGNKGWTVGADASVALVDVGADARVDNKTAQAPIIGFVRTNGGFMANLSIDGTKFTKLPL